MTTLSTIVAARISGKSTQLIARIKSELANGQTVLIPSIDKEKAANLAQLCNCQLRPHYRKKIKFTRSETIVSDVVGGYELYLK